MSNFLKQIRWQQRFINFEKSFQNLSTTASRKDLNTVELAGLIQYFEITFELSWKILKDYLEAEGIIANTPRDTIKQAFALNIITNGEVWLDALEKRDLMTHTYEEEVANYAVALIQSKYTALFAELICFLRTNLFPAQNYGFSLSDYISLVSVFIKYNEIKSVKIFGSRAMGNFKASSDVDLCLFGNLTMEVSYKLQNQLSELTKLPYQFDIAVYSLIPEDGLKKHIDTFGTIIYEI